MVTNIERVRKMNKSNSFRKTIIIASLIFGMLFGAGNLIFPVHLGQLAGKNWLSASSGFLISSSLLPLMALIAISITRSHGIFELAKPISKKYALVFPNPNSCYPRTIVCNAKNSNSSLYYWYSTTFTK